MHVRVVEDVGVEVKVMEALWGEDHANVISTVKERQGLQEELLAGNLKQKDADQHCNGQVGSNPAAQSVT